jgi:hypothetical protein
MRDGFNIILTVLPQFVNMLSTLHTEFHAIQCTTFIRTIRNSLSAVMKPSGPTTIKQIEMRYLRARYNHSQTEIYSSHSGEFGFPTLSRDSSVDIAGQLGSIPGRGNRFFSTLQCPDQLWSPHLASHPMGAGSTFPGSKAAGPGC